MKTVLKLLKALLFSIFTIALGSYLNAVHHNAYMAGYEACKAKLIAENNWNTQEQAFACTRKSSYTLRVLGTILFSEGSILEDL